MGSQVQPPGGDTDKKKLIQVDHQPSAGSLLIRSVGNRTRNTIGLVKGASNALLSTIKHQRSVSKEEIPPADLNAPKTRFNNPVGPHRVAQAAVFELEDFESIKNTFDATINDVALSVIGGAMRRYLDHYNELPEESLAAGIPMNMRTRREMTDDNNQVGSMFCEIHTNIADPIERLAAVHQSALDAKASNEDNPMVEVLRVAGVFSPALTQQAAKLWSKYQLSKFIPANISTVVSNVPGPTIPLYSAGAQMVRYHSLGLLAPGCGVFHLVYSCNGLVTVTLLADRDIIPDPDFYKECLEKSFAETLAAVPGKRLEKKGKRVVKLVKKSAKKA